MKNLFRLFRFYSARAFSVSTIFAIVVWEPTLIIPFASTLAIVRTSRELYCEVVKTEERFRISLDPGYKDRRGSNGIAERGPGVFEREINFVFDTINGQRYLTKVRTAERTFALINRSGKMR